jgi:hypothetical protein
MHILLSTKLQKFLERVKVQYSDDESPYKLNSSYHISRINVNFPNIFLFISSGLLKFETITKDNGNRYVQGMRFTNYNALILSVIYMYIIGVNENSILKIMRQIFLKSQVRLGCVCMAAQMWGSNFWLTQEDSNLGPPENRFPKIRNPFKGKKDVDPKNPNRFARKRYFCCKHLMSIIFFFTNEKNMNEISRKILPHIYKSYGVKHTGGKDQLLKKIGTKGIKKMYLQCTERLKKVDASLVGMFNAVVIGKSNQLVTKMNIEKIKNTKDTTSDNKTKEKQIDEITPVSNSRNNDITDIDESVETND